MMQLKFMVIPLEWKKTANGMLLIKMDNSNSLYGDIQESNKKIRKYRKKKSKKKNK